MTENYYTQIVSRKLVDHCGGDEAARMVCQIIASEQKAAIEVIRRVPFMIAKDGSGQTAPCSDEQADYFVYTLRLAPNA